MVNFINISVLFYLSRKQTHLFFIISCYPLLMLFVIERCLSSREGSLTTAIRPPSWGIIAYNFQFFEREPGIKRPRNLNQRNRNEGTLCDQGLTSA